MVIIKEEPIVTKKKEREIRPQKWAATVDFYHHLWAGQVGPGRFVVRRRHPKIE